MDKTVDRCNNKKALLLIVREAISYNIKHFKTFYGIILKKNSKTI